MKRLLGYLILLVVAVGLGLLIRNDPGYVLFSYRHWVMEMPLWLLLVAVVVLFIIVHHVLLWFNYLLSFSARYQRWSGRRQKSRARNQTSKGLIELIEGHWQAAEKYLIRAVSHGETPLINYLSAARSAQEQGAYDRRDTYLRLAHESTRGSEVAVGLTQAELQLKHGQLEQALATLRHLQSLVPNHKYVLKLLKKLYLRLNDWHSLLNLLTHCMRHKVIDQKEFDALQKQAYLALLEHAARQDDLGAVKACFATLPRKLSQDTDLLMAYSTFLINHGDVELAERLLREAIKYQWSDRLVELYGKALIAPANKQLLQAETWLKNRSDNPILLLTLARLALHNKLWGKARTYLESCISLSEMPAAYLLLGELAQQLEEPDYAQRCFHNSAKRQQLTLPD